MQNAKLSALSLELPTFPGHKRASLEELKGKVVLVDVWATWCAPCRESLPQLQALAERNKGKKLAIVTINIDEDADAVETFVGQIGLTLPVWRDPGAEQVGARLRFSEAPSSYLIDQEGTVRSVHTGYDAETIAMYQRQIDDLLSEE
jgi:thiol-disulfide isomerase/thioredoxin